MASARTLVFLEFADEAEAYFGSQRSDASEGRESIVISVNPRVRTYAKQRGLPSEDTSDYFREEAHARSLRRSVEVCAWIRERFRFMDNIGIETAYRDAVTWYCRHIVHYCLWGVEFLAEATEKRRPSLIMAGSPIVHDLHGHLMHDGERYLGVLAKRLGEDRKIPVVLLLPRRNWRSFISRRWDRFARAVYWTTVAPILAPVYRGVLPGREVPRAVLFTSTSYRMDEVAHGIMLERPELTVLRGRNWPRRGLSLRSDEVYWEIGDAISGEDGNSNRVLAETLAKLACEIESSPQMFTHRGVSFADLVAKKLRVGITPFIRDLHRRAAGIRTLLETVRPLAVVSVGARDDDMVIGEVCSRLKVPALMASHGSHVPPKTELERIEWHEQARRLILAPYPAVALQSPLAEDFLTVLEKSSSGHVSVKVPTGPVVWGRPVDRTRAGELRRRLFLKGPPRRVLVHAGTPKRRGSIRFHVYETLDEYVRTLTELAHAVAQLPDAGLVITFRPHAELRTEDLRELLPLSDRVVLNTDVPCREWLGMADLLVSFSSTTIEEAFQNAVPVLLYGGRGRYQHVPAIEVLPGRPCPQAPVYAVRRPEDLAQALSGILEATGAVPRPDELFGQYRYPKEKHRPLTEWLSSIAH